MAYTVLVTCIGGELGPELATQIRGISGSDIVLIGTDMSENAIGRHFCDEFVKVPSGKNSDYVDCIKSVIRNYGVDFVIPTSDEEAVALSGEKASVESTGARLACVDYETLQIFSDKAKTYETLEEYGFATTSWEVIEDKSELIRLVTMYHDKGIDIAVKPTVDRGARGVFILSKFHKARLKTYHFTEKREIHCHYQTFLSDIQGSSEMAKQITFPLILMERLLEPVYDIDLLAWRGEPVYVVPRKRVDSAIPNRGHTIVDNPLLSELGRSIISRFNLSWLYDCDVMFNRNGDPIIIEINPRPSGSIAITQAAGVPIIESLLSLAQGRDIPRKDIPYGTIVVPRVALVKVD